MLCLLCLLRVQIDELQQLVQKYEPMAYKSERMAYSSTARLLMAAGGYLNRSGLKPCPSFPAGATAPNSPALPAQMLDSACPLPLMSPHRLCHACSHEPAVHEGSEQGGDPGAGG
jgi:hypothetical protein